MSDTDTTSIQPKQNLRFFLIAFAAITALLTASYVLYARFNFEPLYSNLDIEDAALITAELERQEVRYRVGDNGNSVLVPAKEIGQVRLAIYNADGPGRNLTGFELFNESEMGLTDFAQKIKFQRAIQGELSRTIMMMDGVKKSRVHIAIPERSVFRSQKVEPKAAVILVTEQSVNFTVDRVLGIQRLVASSIPELTLDNVIIVDEQGHVVSPPVSFEPSLMNSKNSDLQNNNDHEVLQGVLEVVSADFSPAAVENRVVTDDTKIPLPQPVVTVRKSEERINSQPITSQAFIPINMRPSFILFSLILFCLFSILIIEIIRRTRFRLSDSERQDFATELSLALKQYAAGDSS